LAIGKRGQNVRLAARLTGWDVDILTPQEFQENIERLERTLRQVPEVQENQELIDKIIALGLIDVRDIEEVGEQPLIDELGVEEDLAERMVDVCTEEAKIVMKEQEVKKKAEQEAKEAARHALLAGAPLDGGGADFPPPETFASSGAGFGEQAGIDPASSPSVRPEPESESGSAGNLDVDAGEGVDDAGGEALGEAAEQMRGPMESADGYAPEIVTHDENGSGGDELSPEERAIHGPDGRYLSETSDPAAKEFADEQSEEAALAEGRTPPPNPPTGG